MKPRILIVDSHKGYAHDAVTNMHLRNSMILAEYLNATLVTTNPQSHLQAKGVWDKIIFVHASYYSFVNKRFLDESPKADLFFVTNEYTITPPTLLLLAVKEGRSYSVIANFHKEHSDMKLSENNRNAISSWNMLNLNALIYEDPATNVPEELGFFNNKRPCVYYGTYRPDREIYFKKYFRKWMIVSTSNKNQHKFTKQGIHATFIDKLQWVGTEQRLSGFASSLYIEDTTTHANYNHLANRFYEALSHGIPCFFDMSCRKTVRKSGWNVERFWFVDSEKELKEKAYEVLASGKSYPKEFYEQAAAERKSILEQFKSIILK